MVFSNPYFQLFLIAIASFTIVFITTRRNFGWLHLVLLLVALSALATDVYNFTLNVHPNDVVIVSLMIYFAILATCNLIINVIARKMIKK